MNENAVLPTAIVLGAIVVLILTVAISRLVKSTRRTYYRINTARIDSSLDWGAGVKQGSANTEQVSKIFDGDPVDPKDAALKVPTLRPPTG